MKKIRFELQSEVCDLKSEINVVLSALCPMLHALCFFRCLEAEGRSSNLKARRAGPQTQCSAPEVLMPAIASLEDLKSAQKDLCEILFESVSHNFLLTAHNCVLTLCSTLLALCCHFGSGDE
jgi:hypothetical protein